MLPLLSGCSFAPFFPSFFDGSSVVDLGSSRGFVFGEINDGVVSSGDCVVVTLTAS